MEWINFLHFYQPANIETYSIKKALDKSYWRLMRLMEENPELRMTWNVSGCLLARLADEGEKNFLDRLAALVRSRRLELTGSAAYHAFLPLIPEEEARRQIKANEKILKGVLGKDFRPTGFFLPEMAYTPQLGKLIKSLGYKWIILDEIAYAGGGQRPDFSRIYQDDHSGLKVVFRNHTLSSSYPPDKIIKMLGQPEAAGQPIITATDAELYGLRHEDPTAELENIAADKRLKTATISDLIKRVKGRPPHFSAHACSWESSARELAAGEPFKLWRDRKNAIQKNLWKLTDLSLSLYGRYRRDKNHPWYYWHLVRGIASCTYWWASAKDFSKIFGPYAWSPDGIERGLEDLIRSVRSLNDPRTKKDKLRAEKYYLQIKKLIWEEHWRRHWKKVD